MTIRLRSLGVTAWTVLCAAISCVPAFAQFETRASLPVLPYAQSVAVGDFNRDGKLDLAVASQGPTVTQVSVLLGKGDGTFRAPVNYNVPVAPDQVVVADLRNIGIQDLVVTNFNDSVSVLLGNGDGTFQSAVNYPTPPAPTFVAVGDFNGDHILDIVSIEIDGTCHCLSVLLGNGDGTFQEPPITTSPSFPPFGIGIGDFDSDGKLDVATVGCFFTSCEVNILLGNGDGTFRQGATYSDVIGEGPIAVVDFRGNGKLDLAMPAGNEGVAVLLGNGDGTFQPVVYYGTLVASAASVAAGDVNGDGMPDLVGATTCINYPMCSPSPVEVFLGNGDGTFRPPVTYPAGKSNGAVAVGDFNGDKELDVAVLGIVGVNGYYNDVITLLNTGVVSFSPTTPVSFLPQLIGTTSRAQNVTLTNTGTTALSISSTRVVGPFQLGSRTTCSSSVPAGGKCTLSVVFKPTALGSVAGLLSISDSASTKPQVIELSGAGTVISFSPTGLNFGTQKVGTKSAPQNITATNTGSTAVSVTGVNITGSPNDYSQTNTCGSQIGAGANCTISVTFAPTKTGNRHAAVQITDSGGGGSQSVPLLGTGD